MEVLFALVILCPAWYSLGKHHGYGDGFMDAENGARKHIEELTELVHSVSRATTMDEAWEESERCYDYVHALKGQEDR